MKQLFGQYYKKIIIITLLALLNSACQHVKPESGKTQTQKSIGISQGYFQSNYQHFILSDKTTFKAKMAVKTTKIKQSANVVWNKNMIDHNEKIYTFSLFGPLGVGAVKLQTKNDGSAVFTDNKGRNFRSQNSEELLLNMTGWPVPLKSLAYWVSAMPDPIHAYKYQTDEQGELLSIDQRNWHVQYSQFKLFNNKLMPRKIVARSRHGAESVEVIVIVKSWQWSANKINPDKKQSSKETEKNKVSAKNLNPRNYNVG